MKERSFIFGVIAAACAFAAAITAVILFRNQISGFFETARDKVCNRKTVIFRNDEYDDYADV